MIRARTFDLSKIVAVFGALTLGVWANEAGAIELATPFLPGTTVGIPIGAAPPPGIYVSDDNVFAVGGFKDNAGHDVPLNSTFDINNPVVLWAPNLQLLGAQYSTYIIQPYIIQGLDFTGVGGRATISNGLFNTVISPFNLSWNLKNGIFLGTGLALYLPDGYYSHQLVGGRQVTAQAAIANNFWTFEPNFAISYLKAGWNLTANAVVDINTENNITHFQSGDVFYLDLTVAKSIGKWTFGLGGNITQQFTDDTLFGATIPNNRLQLISAGPLVAYDFGPVSVRALFLAGIHAENGFNLSSFAFKVAAPL